MANPKKFRSFSCISYLDGDQIHKILDRRRNAIRYSAFILHNKDTYTEDDFKSNSEHIPGTLKINHYHILVIMAYPYPLSSFSSWFKGYYDSDGLEINTLVQPCTSPSAQYRYLTHKDDPDKYQYDSKDIITSDPLYFGLEDYTEVGDASFSALEHLLQFHNPLLTARYFGRDFIIHYSSYKSLFEDIAYFPNNYESKPYSVDSSKNTIENKNNVL